MLPSDSPDLTMSDSIHHDFKAEYDKAVSDFRDLRQRYTRFSYDKREFVLVNQVTQQLEGSKSDSFSNGLNRLLVSAHQAYKGGPPDLTLSELETCQTIFYILIELGNPEWLATFHYNGVRDSHLPISLASLRNKFGYHSSDNDASKVDNFLQRFFRLQYSWCPMSFELNMGDSHHDRIIPLYEKKPIIVHRDSFVPQHSHSRLWKVVVPADFISEDLKLRMESTKFSRVVNNGHTTVKSDEDHLEEACYRFVLKEFQTFSDSRSEEESLFRREMKMTKQLKDSDGILQYFGWYQCRGADGCQNFNLVLELGECDFYTYIRTYYPPVSAQEIMHFWEHMVDLSVGLKEIHNLRLDDVGYNMCHGDIKPENIISVKGRFKIADPAEGYVVPSNPGTYPQAAIIGGTITYASPEKSQKQERSATDLNDISNIPMNSDVWSLGCVFSVAATYVVLGELGVEQYELLRRSRNVELREKDTDTFHDGFELLHVVRQWHDYLRLTARRTDKLTNEILDFVDEYMLVSDHINRKAASGVVKLLTEIVYGQMIDKNLEPPPEIDEFLQSLDEDFDALSMEEIVRPTSRMNDTLGLQLPDRSDAMSIRQPTSQRLQQQQVRTSGHRTFSMRQKTGDNGALYLDPIMANGRWPPSQSNSPLEFVNELQSVKDMWMVEADLERLQKAGLFGGRKQRSVKQKKQTAKDDELENFFDNRDLVFLVDNSRSMQQHWAHATYLIRILTWRALGYDEDGMELYFTETSDHVKQKKSQKVDDFRNAMARAKPNSKNSTSPNGIIQTLTNILNNSSQPPQDRPKTIIILTDGVWEGLPKDEAMDKLIRYYLDGLPEDIKKLDKRPITFQFISFGYNKEALERLRRLDDDIQLEDFPDFVDTEHATGDVYKMFLGSLSEEIDQAEYYCPRCAANQPLSQLTSSPVRHHSHSDTRDWA